MSSTATTSATAFVRDSHGQFQLFDPAGSVRTSPAAANARDTVAGTWRDASLVLHGFLRTADGTIVAVDAPMAGTGALQGTTIQGLNRHEVAAGTLVDSAGVDRGFIRSLSGRIVAFDAPGAGNAAGQGTFAQAINSNNQIAGYDSDAGGVFHAYIRTP